MGKLYKPSPFEIGEDGELITYQAAPSVPIDEKAASIIEGAILRLPRQCPDTYRRIDYPRLIVYHMMGNPGPSHFRRTCRKIGIRVSEYDDQVQRSATMLHHMLDCNQSQVYKCETAKAP